MNAISVQHLSKTFTYYKKKEGLGGSIRSLFKRDLQTKHAVTDVSFEIAKGEFVGFVGPNGAGKTTTLKVLSGILYPTQGNVRVLGYEPKNREDAFKKKISIVMGQRSQLEPMLPATDSFQLFRHIYDIPEQTYRKRLKELSTLFEIEDVLQVQVRKLSLGQRMKCELIASLIHNPSVLFLDEPTIGLDIVAQQNIRHFLKRYNEQYGTTIILTSHYMDDVQDLCKRLIVINGGRVGYDGPIANIISEYGDTKRVKIKLDDRITKKDAATFGTVTSWNGYEIEYAIPAINVRDRISHMLTVLPINDISIHAVTLEEVISDLFQKTKSQIE